MPIDFMQGDKLLFQGDSITDCHRNRFVPSDLGFGYAALVGAYIRRHLKSLNFQVVNRGIYGNRTVNLKHRWERSTMREEPHILSLLVGINDTWRRYDRRWVTSPRRFYDNYSYLLERTVTGLPDIQFVILSPFVLPVTAGQEEWMEDLAPKIEIVEALARDYHAVYIPLQQIFDGLISEETPRNFYVKDGVHPTLEGHKVIAREWISATGLDQLVRK